jgi:MFS family permease
LAAQRCRGRLACGRRTASWPAPGLIFPVQGLGPLAGFMQDALQLSAFEIGLLMSAAQFVPVIGLLIAGELLDRFSERLIVGLGTLVVGAALASASFASTYENLFIWLLIVGAGYSTAQPGGSKAVSNWFSKSQRGFAMGIRQAGLPLGGGLAAAILPSVAAAHGWQAAFLIGAIVACLGGALFIAVYRSPAEIRPQSAVSLKSAFAARLSLLGERSMRNIMLSGPVLITVQYGILVFFVLHVVVTRPKGRKVLKAHTTAAAVTCGPAAPDVQHDLVIVRPLQRRPDLT